MHIIRTHTHTHTHTYKYIYIFIHREGDRAPTSISTALRRRRPWNPLNPGSFTEMRVGLVVGPLTPAIEVALAKGPKLVPPGEEDDDVYYYIRWRIRQNWRKKLTNKKRLSRVGCLQIRVFDPFSAKAVVTVSCGHSCLHHACPHRQRKAGGQGAAQGVRGRRNCTPPQRS